MVPNPQTARGALGTRPDSDAAAPTLDFLCRSLGLRFATDSARAGADRSVRGVWWVDEALVLPDAREDLRDLVVVAPATPGEYDPAEVDPFVRRLAKRKVAALAWPLIAGVSGPPAALTDAAATLSVPVLVVPGGVQRSRIAQVISDERCRVAQAHARMPGELLAEVRNRLDQHGAVRQLADWLARTIDGAVTITSATGDPVAEAPPGARQIMEPVAETIARVAAHRLDSATIDVERWRVRLLPVGDGTPRAVLAVARTQPFGRTPTRVVDHAADVLPLMLRIQEANAYERRTRRVLSAARVGVLQMLMGGQLSLAQRTAAAVTPGLLDADEGRVLILTGRPEDRDAAVTECSEATRGRALVVRCPVYDTNVIIVAPDRGPRPGGPQEPDRWEVLAAGLRDVAAARQDRCLGGSGLTHLGATADAYREATHALATARQIPERVVLHCAETPLLRVLDHRAHAWARSWLHPILALRPNERDQMLDTLRLVLEFRVAGAARITGRHRNTVSTARKRAAALLGLDMGDVLTRAQLDLSLRVFGHTRPDTTTAGPVSLSDLLATEPARHWARRWLAALDQDARDLRRTLVAWIGCNTHVERAAARLGLYPDTVRDHLKAVDGLLHRDLMSPSGPHDLVLALLVVGALPVPAAPAPPA